MKLDLSNSLAITLYAFVYIMVVSAALDMMGPKVDNCEKYQGEDKLKCLIDTMKNSISLKKEKAIHYLVGGVLSLIAGYYIFYNTDWLKIGLTVIVGGMFLLLFAGIMGSDNGTTNYNAFYILMALLTTVLAIGGILFFQVLAMSQFKE